MLNQIDTGKACPKEVGLLKRAIPACPRIVDCRLLIDRKKNNDKTNGEV